MPQARMETANLYSLSSADHILGPATATVTVIEYGDFQCPFCRAAYPAVKVMLEHFQAHVRFVFRHFPVVEAHPLAERAAEAAEAAGAQGRFWAMHDRLFEHQQHLQDEYLRQYAFEARLDMPQYLRDMESRLYLPRVREQRNSGKRMGCRGTPNFFVNGVLEDVSFGMDNLYRAIEANLLPANTG